MKVHNTLNTILGIGAFPLIYVLVTPVVFFLFSATSLAASEITNCSSSNSNSERLLHQQTWSPSVPTATEMIELKAQIYSEGNLNWSKLKILQDDKVIFTFDPGPMYSDSMFILDNGNLACRWSEGMGNTHRFVVFGYLNSSVSKLLDLESEGLVQEFVYPLRGKILLTNGETVQPYEHRIINPVVDWTMPKGKTASELQPLAADIYTWNSSAKVYSVRKKVRWDKRLLQL